MKGVTGQRPERQLNDVVIKFHRRVLEIMQPVDNQDADQCAYRADEPPRQGKNQGKSDEHRRLRSGVIGDIGAEHAMHRLNQPPWQRR